ncbi:MAG: AMP-binding protein [Dehalococcoidia bacterium]|nr:AMP-binding protein [Dehalococcoidia bacterium]
MDSWPWLKNYDQGVPYTLEPYPQRTMVDVVDESRQARPYRSMFFFKGARLTYDDFVRQSDALAVGLVALGIKKGDRVAMLLPNLPQMVLGFQGIWKAGAIAVPLNPLYTEHELEHALSEVDVTAVITLSPFYNLLKSFQERTHISSIIATNIKEYLPADTALLFTLFKEKKEGYRIGLKTGDVWFQDLLRKYRNIGRPAVEVFPSDPAVILFSGGTTGIPRGVVGTHAALVMTAMQINAWFSPAVDQWQDRVMLTMPLFHVYGCVGVLGAAMVNHSSCILVPNPRDLTDVVKSIKKYHPAFMPGVPSFYIGIMDHPLVESGKVTLKSMKLCIVGAESLTAEVKRRFESMTGGRMLEGYTLTECMQAATLNPVKSTYKEGAVGLPLPDIVIRIADPVTGEGSMKAGKLGEICFKAPNLMTGYWNRPEETADILKEGWLYTGDIGYLDEDGYLFLHSRKKHIIKTSGFQVWPREVEEILYEHPAVKEAGVAGVPDPYQGEAVKAWVVLNPGAKCTPEELREHCRIKLAAYKIPKQIEIRADLPKSQIGKILRRVLIEEEDSRKTNDN